ncbi:hypothetical protein TNCV_2354311 [Trichonephila clavipes]|nr:hypothetical protein TNCV_2354311 [Trichonephila clavipes]
MSTRRSRVELREHHSISPQVIKVVVFQLPTPSLGTRAVAAVAEWYRHRIVAGFVTSSSPVPLKTRRVGQRCTLNLSRAETTEITEQCDVNLHSLTRHSCMRSACDQSTLPIDVQVFHCKARDPHVEALRVGCHLSRSPRHPTEVPNHTVFERRVRYSTLHRGSTRIFETCNLEVGLFIFYDNRGEQF